MDIFKNATTAVESFSVYKDNNDLHKMSDFAAGSSKIREMAEQEKCLESQRRIDNIDKEYDKQKLVESVVTRELIESRMEHKIGEVLNVGKVKLLKDVLFEVFYNSLVIDSDFLAEHVDVLRNLTDSYVDQNGGYKVLENAILKTDSLFLKAMKSNIDKIALEVCNRKIKECKTNTDVNILDFDLNEKEQEELDYSKDELNLDEISNLVKKKVLTVIKDEKEHEEAEATLINDIENELINDDSVTDKKSLDEAMSKLIINKPVVEDSSLFNSLLRNSYREYLTENVSIRTSDEKNISDDKDNAKIYNPNIDDDDIEETGDPEKYVEDELDMDLVLVEAITQYTLMETLYTIKLEEYKYDNIQKLVHKMCNVVNA